MEAIGRKAGSVGDQGKGDQVVLNFRYRRRRQGARGGYQQAESGSRISQPSDRNRKNINPLGPGGRILTCKSCGSYRHLLPECPDSWKNMSKVNVVEEEHTGLFTGYNTEEVRR